MAVLTGAEIRKAIGEKRISCSPYEEKFVGTNSIDLRLHPTLRVYAYGEARHNIWAEWNQKRIEYLSQGGDYNTFVKLWPGPTDSDVAKRKTSFPIMDMLSENGTKELEIPSTGLVLWPGVLYLGRTVETIGSKCYVPWFDGRSSIGRLGIHVHVTAGRGDTGWYGTVTLEIHVVQPIRIYANSKPICQATFFDTIGDLEEYNGRYQNQTDPTPSRFHLDDYDRI